jgi:hypothetical protein
MEASFKCSTEIEFDFLLRSDKGFSKHCKFADDGILVAFEC